MPPLSGRRCLGLSGLGRLGRHRVRRGRLRGTGVLLRALLLRLAGGRLLRPFLVELDAPLALVGLLQPQLRAEGPPGARAEAGDRLLGASYARLIARLTGDPQRLDQLLGHRYGQRLPRLLLPDHEAAAGVLARPARVALPVLGDLASADRAGAELRALLNRLGRELLDVLHERRARVAAALDQPEPVFPAAGELGRGQLVVAEEADHLD